jgi:signal peptidase I
VFQSPTEPDKDYIKRVIGLPGDTVLVNAGSVYVNGLRLDEPYIAFPPDYRFPSDGQLIQVPDGSYFVLGDNRPVSVDSHLGWFVPAANLVGRAWLSYWPPQTWGPVASGGPSSAASTAYLGQ